jgi:hypothetical protein
MVFAVSSNQDQDRAIPSKVSLLKAKVKLPLLERILAQAAIRKFGSDMIILKLTHFLLLIL